MMNSEVDPKVWERKDRMIVAQTSLERAIITVNGLGASGLDKFTLENVKKRVFETAEDYYNWVFGKADENGNTTPISNSTESTNYPVPTTTQLKWLKAIEEKHGFTPEQIFDKQKKYPNSKETAIETVKLMKG